MRRTILFFLFLAVIAAVAWGFRRGWNDSAVEVVQPRRGPAVLAVYATGTVEATVMLPISPRVGGRLVELFADEGARVSTGQNLAKLDDVEMIRITDELQARERYARDELERQRLLFKKSATPRQTLDRAASEWEAAKAAVQAAEARAGYMSLNAPADGQIIRRDGEVGEYIAVDKPVFWLSADGPLRISAEVDEEDISLVAPGQKVLIGADAFPGEVFHGEVQSITPKGDPIQRSYRVRIGFQKDAPLKIGMTAENNIIIRRSENALLVPSAAVTKGVLWVVTDGRLSRREVKTGAAALSETEILSGLADTDLVAVQPGPALREGAKVRTVLKN